MMSNKWFQVFVLFVAVQFSYAQDSVILTEEEQQWLHGHEITLGFLNDYPPYIYNGEIPENAIGIIPDIHNAIEGSLGININLVTADWFQLHEWLNQGIIDGIYGLNENYLERDYIMDGGYFMSTQRGIFGKTQVSQMEDFQGSSIGYIRGSNILPFFEENQEIDLVPYNTIHDIYRAIEEDKVDFGLLITGYSESSSTLAPEEIILAYPETVTYNAHIGINTQYPLSASILKRVISSFSPDFFQRIQEYWFHQKSYGEYQIPLSDEEWEWLSQHRIIRVGIDDNWPPLEYYESGQVKGITRDYLTEIEQMLEIQFEIVPASWPETYDNFLQGSVDMLSCLQELPERHEVMDFTHSYISMPFALVGRADLNYHGDLSKLKNIHIGVLGSPASLSLMQENYPNIEFSTYRDLASAIDAVQDGEIEAFAGTFQTLIYKLGHGGYYDLQVIGQLPVSLELSMGIRKDWIIFRNILNKALNHIPYSRQEEIQRKWIFVNIQKEVNYQLLWRISLFFSLALILLIIWIILLSRRERKRQAHWLEARRMESLGRMAGGVAHDFKNILMGISGYTELLNHFNKDETTEGYLDEILLSVDQGTELVNQILIYSSPKLVKKTLFSLQEVMDNAIKFLHSIDRNSTEIEVLIPDLPPFYGDKIQIQQLIINIGHNALQATENQDESLLQIHVQLDTTSKETQVLILRIQDNGPGIDKELQNSIFDPYFTTKDIGKGTGLGLATVKRIVDNHEGRIEMESNPESGTLFIIRLPIMEG